MKNNKITRKLIAICGMDCRLCSAYKREKNGCLGCRGEIGSNLDYCNRCKIKNCEKAVNGNLLYCFQCESYPCKKIKHIDKRYSTKYGMSMIENFELIKRFGIRKFLMIEEEKWTCPQCGQILCVHKPYCLNCQYPWR
jgi:hypothetical protein